jgi:hypothetical protein
MRFQRLVVVFVTILAAPGATLAREAVKTFPAYQCRYTLPGGRWYWVDPGPVPHAVCVARNGDGLEFMLLVTPVPAGTVIDARFSATFDRAAYPAGGAKSRGGRMTTFKGLPCYESDGLLDSKTTAVTRVVIANGFGYRLQLLGGADPVEKRPDFEAVMNGFEFTAPPVPPVPAVPPTAARATDPDERGKSLSELSGELLAYCAIGVFLVGLATWGRRRK